MILCEEKEKENKIKIKNKMRSLVIDVRSEGKGKESTCVYNVVDGGYVHVVKVLVR